MTDAQILESLSGIFRQVFDDDSIVATPEMTASDVERWDSLSHVDMIVLVEETFGFRIPTREVMDMKNVGELVRLIQSRQS